MHVSRHNATLRIILAVAFWAGLAVLAQAAVADTNLDADIVPTGRAHDLSPIGAVARVVLWCLAATLLIIAGVLLALRRWTGPSFYKETSDEQWTEDSHEAAGDRVEASQVMEACEVLEKGPQPAEAAEAPAEPEPPAQERLFTPASGAAWREPMLKAFLNTCMKVNCLGRTWREAAARQAAASNLPDPREAELIRRLMQRWQEFHVDPEAGVFLDRSASAGKNRVCIIRVSKDKHTLAEAAFNAGFVVDSVGRYLKNTDLVYKRGLGDYHAPTNDELKAMTPGERESMIRITDIPDPWQAMIAGKAGPAAARRIPTL